MNTWMRRRIERSRARCEKTPATYKTDKPRTQETKARTNEGADEAEPPAPRDSAR